MYAKVNVHLTLYLGRIKIHVNLTIIFSNKHLQMSASLSEIHSLPHFISYSVKSYASLAL